MDMMEFEIESGIPIPAPVRARKSKYPWSDLKVNDSFVVPGGKVKSLASAVSAAAKRFKPKKFAMRTVDGGVRVWRVQ